MRKGGGGLVCEIIVKGATRAASPWQASRGRYEIAQSDSRIQMRYKWGFLPFVVPGGQLFSCFSRG